MVTGFRCQLDVFCVANSTNIVIINRLEVNVVFPIVCERPF